MRGRKGPRRADSSGRNVWNGLRRWNHWVGFMENLQESVVATNKIKQIYVHSILVWKDLPCHAQRPLHPTHFKRSCNPSLEQAGDCELAKNSHLPEQNTFCLIDLIAASPKAVCCHEKLQCCWRYRGNIQGFSWCVDVLKVIFHQQKRGQLTRFWMMNRVIWPDFPSHGQLQPFWGSDPSQASWRLHEILMKKHWISRWSKPKGTRKLILLIWGATHKILRESRPWYLESIPYCAVWLHCWRMHSWKPHGGRSKPPWSKFSGGVTLVIL